jgi:hypothetical protein
MMGTSAPQQLKMAQPENLNFDGMQELQAQPDSLGLCREAKNLGAFQSSDFNGIDLSGTISL